ncbi:unnamed protein product [Ranitomeya imitator]|uniref:Uncharacterized protein n=1 Tax=Ranitomeya imitator TaxID=111125 RepID=A0ABN9MKJ9_9NEOB|nr:unnamed protein product [Ranitomeya imitator]
MELQLQDRTEFSKRAVSCVLETSSKLHGRMQELCERSADTDPVEETHRAQNKEVFTENHKLQDLATVLQEKHHRISLQDRSVGLRRSRSVKTRRGRHLMKIGGAGPQCEDKKRTSSDEDRRRRSRSVKTRRGRHLMIGGAGPQREDKKRTSSDDRRRRTAA